MEKIFVSNQHFVFNSFFTILLFTDKEMSGRPPKSISHAPPPPDNISLVCHFTLYSHFFVYSCCIYSPIIRIIRVHLLSDCTFVLASPSVYACRKLSISQEKTVFLILVFDASGTLISCLHSSSCLCHFLHYLGHSSIIFSIFSLHFLHFFLHFLHFLHYFSPLFFSFFFLHSDFFFSPLFNRRVLVPLDLKYLFAFRCLQFDLRTGSPNRKNGLGIKSHSHTSRAPPVGIKPPSPQTKAVARFAI
jgi:hypothetical protein